MLCSNVLHRITTQMIGALTVFSHPSKTSSTQAGQLLDNNWLLHVRKVEVNSKTSKLALTTWVI
eukprot:661763-Pelagomonas_calceolata.AAC.2